jgi:hypothetical protein
MSFRFRRVVFMDDFFRSPDNGLPYIPHIVRANNSQLAHRGAALAG